MFCIWKPTGFLEKMAKLRPIVVALFSLFLDVSSSWTLVPQANSLSAAPEAASDERGATQEQNATLVPPWFSLPRGSIFLSGASANASADDDASANLTDSAAVFFNASLPACLALDLYDLILNSATLQSSNSRITERMRPADSSYSDVNPAAIALGLMVVLALVLIFGGAAFPRTSLFIVSTVFTFMLLLAFFVFLNEAEFNPTKRFFECVFPLAISSVLSLVIGIRTPPAPTPRAHPRPRRRRTHRPHVRICPPLPSSCACSRHLPRRKP